MKNVYGSDARGLFPNNHKVLGLKHHIKEGGVSVGVPPSMIELRAARLCRAQVSIKSRGFEIYSPAALILLSQKAAAD
jgi:hypothetical protein